MCEEFYKKRRTQVRRGQSSRARTRGLFLRRSGASTSFLLVLHVRHEVVEQHRPSTYQPRPQHEHEACRGGRDGKSRQTVDFIIGQIRFDVASELVQLMPHIGRNGFQLLSLLANSQSVRRYARVTYAVDEEGEGGGSTLRKSRNSLHRGKWGGSTHFKNSIAGSRSMGPAKM